MYKMLISISAFLITLLLNGCSIFQSSYPERMAPVQANVAANQPDQALQQYYDEFGKQKEDKKQSIEPLYTLELARLYQYDGNYQASQKQYEAVIQYINDQMLKAVIQMSSILDNAEAVATNDRALPYVIPAYEQTFLYAYQAINYLNQHDLENALVSIRQLSEAQKWTVKQQKINTQSKKALTDKDKAASQNTQKYIKTPEYQAMQDATQTIANSYENGFAYYLASILYQAYNDDFNDAFVSIKQAKRLLPDNPYVEQTYQQIKRGFNDQPPYEENHGRLAVIYQQGLVNAKRAFALPLFLGRLGMQRISLPYYSTKNIQAKPVNFVINDKSNGDSKTQKMALLVNTDKMAIQALKEQYPSIVTREVLRVILKSSATYALSKQEGGAGLIGLIIGSIYSVATSGADLRSWLLLPKNVQLYAKALKQGDYHMSIGQQDLSFEIRAGKTTLLLIDQIRGYQKVMVHQL